MGDNKVTCDKCDGKRATTKSIRFLSLSYFLGTRLGRLIFNYHKKINLSLYFNAKQYLYSDDDKEAIGSYNVDFDLDNNNNNTSVKPNTDNSQVDMFYELYSIFIHDGGAGDGHYYAHIKDFESDDLIRFNNSVHQKPKEECIRIFAKQDNLNAKPQAKKIAKSEAPTATTEKTCGKEKEDVTTTPALFLQHQHQKMIKKQKQQYQNKKIRYWCTISCNIGNTNENDRVGAIVAASSVAQQNDGAIKLKKVEKSYFKNKKHHHLYLQKDQHII